MKDRHVPIGKLQSDQSDIFLFHIQWITDFTSTLPVPVVNSLLNGISTEFIARWLDLPPADLIA